ncbi:hypothetical protein ABC345_19795 [Shouchella sp. 1P09AA]|uniref:hypothetical protein n=1 Tax=unclassified Shouchella TaxID=2893065 RepID=UPI0039A0DD51
MTELIWIIGIVLLLLLIYNAAIHPRVMKARRLKRIEKKLVENDEYKDLLIATCKAIEKELRRADDAVDEIKRHYNLMGTKTNLSLEQKSIVITFVQDDEQLTYSNGNWSYVDQDEKHFDVPFNHYDADFYHQASDVFRLLPLWCQAANTHYFLPEDEAKMKREQIEAKLFREIRIFIDTLASKYEPNPLLNVHSYQERNSG